MTDQELPTMPVVKYSMTEAALTALGEKYAKPDASTPEGYEVCKSGCKELTSLRTGLETERKRLKGPALDYGRKLDAEAKRIKDRIVAIEAPVAAEKEKVDAVERERALEKAQDEQARKDTIQSKIDSMAPDITPDKTSADYAMAMTWLTQAEIHESIYEEFTEAALQARDASLHKLRVARDAAAAQEQADKDRAEEDARLAEERAKQKKRQDDLDAQELVLQAGEDAVEADKRRVAADAQKVIDDAAAAAQKAIDDKAAEEAAEQQRKDDIADAERKAEEKRIADEEEAERQEALKPDKQKMYEFASEIGLIHGPSGLDDAGLQEVCAGVEDALRAISGKLHARLDEF